MNNSINKYLFYYPATYLSGEHIAKHLKFSDDFQWQSTDTIKSFADKSIDTIIKFSREHSTYYRESIPEAKQYDANSIRNIPTINKQQLIHNLSSIKTDFSVNSSVKTTGGSTGEPVKIIKNRDALARERAATWRSYRWAGIDIGSKQARLWGIPHSQQNKLKYQILDFIGNRKRFSAFSLTPESMRRYYAEMQQFQPDYIYGYVSAIAEYTSFLEQEKLAPIASVKAVITTSEILADNQRKLISRYWNCKVFNEYGCGEVGSIAHECEHGKMHIMAENLLVEILDNNGNACSTGEVVVTDYHNLSSPLIRYRLGDYATLSHEPCACGRNLPILEGIHGRAYDLLTFDNRVIHPEAMIYIFEDIQTRTGAFRQFQAIQTSPLKLVINIIKTPQWVDNIENSIRQKILEKIHPEAEIEFCYVDAIAREASGKMRVVKSLVSKSST